MTHRAIYEAAAGIVTDFAAEQSPQLAVAYQGISFDPPDDAPWLEVRIFPNETRNYGLSNQGPSVLVGFVQVSVCAQPCTGVVAAMDVADEIIGLFAKGTALDVAHVEAMPWASSVVESDNKIMVPVTVRYRGMVMTAVPVPSLLLEDGDKLLLESGDALLLEA